jgi:hypothetical protein
VYGDYMTTYATDRNETDPCERGTEGCPVKHQSEEPCETW